MNPTLGEIILVGFTFAPDGWAICDGTVLSISQNSALFALLGNRYGGDGVTTFALPNLTAPPELRYLIALQGHFPSRD